MNEVFVHRKDGWESRVVLLIWLGWGSVKGKEGRECDVSLPLLSSVEIGIATLCLNTPLFISKISGSGRRWCGVIAARQD